VEFPGENPIEDTPNDETVRIYTGNAFDITGERRQTKFVSNMRQPMEFATVRVAEHLYRWSNWTITEESPSAEREEDANVYCA
jgi:hypothetical protein